MLSKAEYNFWTKCNSLNAPTFICFLVLYLGTVTTCTVLHLFFNGLLRFQDSAKNSWLGKFLCFYLFLRLFIYTSCVFSEYPKNREAMYWWVINNWLQKIPRMQRLSLLNFSFCTAQLWTTVRILLKWFE